VAVTPSPVVTPTQRPTDPPTPSPTASPPILTTADPVGDVVTEAGAAITDPEADITQTAIQKVGDAYRVTVTLAAGLTQDYSFALLLDIGSQSEVVGYIWERHGTTGAMRVGLVDRQTGQILAGEADGVRIVYDRATGRATFEFPGSQLPSGTDRYRVRAFHAPNPGDIRRGDFTEAIDIGGIICGATCR
jgi:hypothetical protein